MLDKKNSEKITFRIFIVTIFTWFLVGILIGFEYIFFMPIVLIWTALFDRKQKRCVFYLTKFFIKLFFALYFTSNFKIILGNLKKSDGPRIYILNHSSQFDTFLIYLLPDRIKVFVKENYVKIPFIGWTIMLSGNILVKKPVENYSEESNVVLEGINEIKNGATLLVFPEGTKSRTGDINRFKLGSFRIGYETKAEIVPVVLDSWNAIRPGGGWWIRDDKVWMKALEPIKYENYKNLSEKEFSRMLKYKMTEELLIIRDLRRNQENKYYRNFEKYITLDNDSYRRLEEYKNLNKIII